LCSDRTIIYASNFSHYFNVFIHRISSVMVLQEQSKRQTQAFPCCNYTTLNRHCHVFASTECNLTTQYQLLNVT
jgi:hypothetical protein